LYPGSTVVEHLTHNTENEGSNPVTVIGIFRLRFNTLKVSSTATVVDDNLIKNSLVITYDRNREAT
jgi:hypothetical protein